MKKTLALLLCVFIIATTLCGCAAAKTEEKAINSEKLSEVLSKMYSSSGLSSNTYENLVTTEVSAERLEAYFGTSDIDFESAVASEPEMGYGYSVCLLRVKEGADVDAAAEKILSSANPNKWICVTAKDVCVKTNGRVILLCMTSTETCDALASAFLALK